jgi:hypothetical protein
LAQRVSERWIVGNIDGPRSNVWRLWSKGNDVYLASGGLGGVSKFSFHESGRCRIAFTKEHGTPEVLADRAINKWWRAATPVADGNGRASCVLQVGIPTDTLSTALKRPLKRVTCIAAAPAGMATVLEMFFTLESRETLITLSPKGGRELASYAKLPSREAFAVAVRHATWDGEDFGMPASHHETRDFIFSRSDPENTGRPIRLTMNNNPKDGDSMLAWEFGGYPAPAGTWELIRPKPTGLPK